MRSAPPVSSPVIRCKMVIIKDRLRLADYGLTLRQKRSRPATGRGAQLDITRAAMLYGSTARMLGIRQGVSTRSGRVARSWPLLVALPGLDRLAVGCKSDPGGAGSGDDRPLLDENAFEHPVGADPVEIDAGVRLSVAGTASKFGAFKRGSGDGLPATPVS